MVGVADRSVPRTGGGTLRVVLLPGAVLPADLAYGDLVRELGEGVEAITKDLEVYRTDAPPPDYSLRTEADGVLAEVDRLGWDRFHLVGYSGGRIGCAGAGRAPSGKAAEPGRARTRVGGELGVELEAP